MTLDEKIIACARTHGYKGKVTVPNKKEINGKIQWRIYFIGDNEKGADGIYTWIVKDEQLKQWERNNKIEQIL